MTINTWDPSAATAANDFQIELGMLQRYIDIVRNDQLNQISQLLSSQEQQTQANVMQQDKDSWFAVAQSLNDEEITDLMRFFTVAESLPGWEAGDKSPVIWLGKVLKKRGTGIEKELVVWIKSHSNNQFLPHGALL